MSMNPDGINEGEVKETPLPELATNESDFYKSIDNEQGKISESVRGDEHFQERASEMGSELSPDQIKEKYDELGDPNDKVEAYKDAVLGDHPDWTPEQRAEAIQEAKENWEGDVASREVYQMAMDVNDDRMEGDIDGGISGDAITPDDGNGSLDAIDDDSDPEPNLDPETGSPESNAEQSEGQIDDAGDSDSDIEPPIIPDWSKTGEVSDGKSDDVNESSGENKSDGTDADAEKTKEAEESKKAEGEKMSEETKESEEGQKKQGDGLLNILGRSANGEVVHRIDGEGKEKPGDGDDPKEIKPPTDPDDDGRTERNLPDEILVRDFLARKAKERYGR